MKKFSVQYMLQFATLNDFGQFQTSKSKISPKNTDYKNNNTKVCSSQQQQIGSQSHSDVWNLENVEQF